MTLREMVDSGKAIEEIVAENWGTELLRLFNEETKQTRSGFKSQESAVKVITRLFNDNPTSTNESTNESATVDETAPKQKVKKEKVAKPPKERKISAMGSIRTYFDSHSHATLDELMALTGKSAPWIQCAMAIFRNPARCGKQGIIDSTYDRATKSFVLNDKVVEANA